MIRQNVLSFNIELRTGENEGEFSRSWYIHNIPTDRYSVDHSATTIKTQQSQLSKMSGGLNSVDSGDQNSLLRLTRTNPTVRHTATKAILFTHNSDRLLFRSKNQLVPMNAMLVIRFQ